MFEVKRYRNHIIGYEVEAVQFDGTDESKVELKKWIEERTDRYKSEYTDGLLFTIHGRVLVAEGDWVVLSLEDDERFFPYPNDAFEAMFEEMTE